MNAAGNFNLWNPFVNDIYMINLKMATLVKFPVILPSWDFSRSIFPHQNQARNAKRKEKDEQDNLVLEERVRVCRKILVGRS